MNQTILTEMLLRLLIAGLLGGIIGLEREYRGKEAGVRTHFLVALGSALFMVLSIFGFENVESVHAISFDPSRIAGQVVTGIGFIGAGTIILQKHVVRGLTTAAGLWVTSAVGLVAGTGMWQVATSTVAFVVIGLELLNALMHRFGSRMVTITFNTRDKQEIRHLLDKLHADGMTVQTYSLHEHATNNEGKGYSVQLEIKMKRNYYVSHISDFIANYDGIEVESVE